MFRHLTLVAVLALIWPAAANAQSLAELAKKNKKKDKESSQTITSRELARAGGSRGGNVSPPRAASANPSDAGSEAEAGSEGEGEESGEEKSPEELREEARAAWSERMGEAEAEVARLDGRVAQLEQSLANPGIGTVEQRQQRVEQLANATTDLAAARQNVTALQREGRQNGYRR